MSESIKFVGINNTKLVNKLKENGGRLLPDREYIISVGSGKAGPEISFRLSGSENVTLSYIDFLILDTAQLFFEWPLSEKYGRRFTLRKFIKVMTGGENGGESSEPAQISPKRLEYIRSRIEHLSNVNIFIDMTNENRRVSEKGDVPPHPTGIIENPLLPVAFDSEKREYYFIADILPLYEYASVNRQVIRVPAEVFFCTGELTNTEMNLILKYFLIHEIEVMTYRNEHERNFAGNKIYYYKSDKEGLLPLLGYTRADHPDDRRKKFVTRPKVLNKLRSVHGSVSKILDCYKKHGLIKDYLPITLFDNGAPKGVEIVLKKSRSEK